MQAWDGIIVYIELGRAGSVPDQVIDHLEHLELAHAHDHSPREKLVISQEFAEGPRP